MNWLALAECSSHSSFTSLESVITEHYTAFYNQIALNLQQISYGGIISDNFSYFSIKSYVVADMLSLPKIQRGSQKSRSSIASWNFVRIIQNVRISVLGTILFKSHQKLREVPSKSKLFWILFGSKRYLHHILERCTAGLPGLLR